MQEDIVNSVISAIDWIIKYLDENKYISIYLSQKHLYLIINIEVSALIAPQEHNPKLNNASIKTKVIYKNDKLVLNLLIPIK
ncbi:MAG: hypothetical protein ACLRT4_07705 [Thomasclavelia sp.]